MYCPKCGKIIYDSGSFCSCCGKNIVYLKEQATPIDAEPPVDGSSLQPVETTGELIKKKDSSFNSKKSAAKYFCSFCGIGIDGDDNVCFKCGKKLLKEYYWTKKKNVLWWIRAVLGLFRRREAVHSAADLRLPG